jgi:flagellar biosynthesis protein FlhB
VLVLLAAVASGGWNFSPQALIPDFTRMNPLEGVKRLFGCAAFPNSARRCSNARSSAASARRRGLCSAT